MSRKASRSSKTKTPKRAATARTLGPTAKEAPAVAKIARPVVAAPSARNDRLWKAILVGGAAVAFLLLGREVSDIFVDRAQPILQKNDIYSALESVALLVIIGVIAYSRRRLSAPPSGDRR